jgi:uncharacterized protein (TIGR03083 family)
MRQSRIEALKSDLRSSAERVQTVVAKLDERAIVNSTENPTWSVRDILAHLVVSEPGMVANARRFLAGSGGVPPDFRVDEWNERQVAKRAGMTGQELVAELTENRQKTLEFLDGVSEGELDRRGRHADLTEMSVEELFRTLMSHEQTHIAEIDRALT